MRVINFLEAMDGDQDLKDEESCEELCVWRGLGGDGVSLRS